jgi:hypothetical protein
MSWDVVCLDIMVVDLDCSLVDAYLSDSYQEKWGKGHTIKKRDLGLVDRDV